MHTHFSALHVAGTFLGVVAVGGFWRLTAAHLGASANPTAQLVGKTMLFQY